MQASTQPPTVMGEHVFLLVGGNRKTLVAQNLYNLSYLTLSGMGQGFSTHMSLIDQILSADFFFKKIKLGSEN